MSTLRPSYLACFTALLPLAMSVHKLVLRVSADSLGRLSDGSPVLGGTCPLAVVQSGPSGSPLFHTRTSCTGTLTALEQQPHQQLQQQQRRQSASLLLADGTSACAVCPPSVDPAAMPECLQPWQEQNEPWHERQQVLLADGGVGVGSVEVGIYRQGSTTPVSLSTTMTSCMDDEYGQGAHDVQQQEVGVVGDCDAITTFVRCKFTACRCAGNALTQADLQRSVVYIRVLKTLSNTLLSLRHTVDVAAAQLQFVLSWFAHAASC